MYIAIIVAMYWIGNKIEFPNIVCMCTYGHAINSLTVTIVAIDALLFTHYRVN